MKKRFISVLLILCLALALLPATALAARDETVMTAELPGFALKGYQGSTAEKYAFNYGIDLFAVDGSDTELWLGTGVVSLDNFAVMFKAEYTSGQFADVDETQWYGANKSKAIKTAFELRIVNGKGGGIFDPNGKVLLSEAIKMAAVVHHIYSGGNGTLPQDVTNIWYTSNQWYDPYVNYCVEQGIIGQYDFGQNYGRPATRAEMAYIFANALPHSELPAINDITALPDVDDATQYSEDIFTLYRCGALQGNDEYGTFTPNADITRAAAAAIIARIALPEQRLTFTLKTKSTPVTAGSYTPGMWVYSLDELGQVYKERAEGLYPDMSVHISETLAQELYNTPGFYFQWARISVSTVYNENGDNMLVIKLGPYDLVNELDALLSDRSVSGRASAKANACLAQMDDILAQLGVFAMSERDALAAIHDWMIANISYDTDFGDASYHFYGPLDSGKAVCSGYSELFYYLANLAGIECYTVDGEASSGPGQTDWGGHAWNVVLLKGDDIPYYVDVTYDDPLPDTATGRRNYFMVTAEQLAKDHRW